MTTETSRAIQPLLHMRADRLWSVYEQKWVSVHENHAISMDQSMVLLPTPAVRRRIDRVVGNDATANHFDKVRQRRRRATATLYLKATAILVVSGALIGYLLGLMVLS